MSTHILLATDGRASALGAVHLARALARRDGCRVTVIGVVEPVALFGTGAEFTPPPAALEIERRQAALLYGAIAEQLDQVGPEAAAWPIRIEAGPLAPTLVRAAEDLGATLLVLGRGRNGAVERWVGGEAVLEVIQIAQVPVLAVHPSARELPRSVLVGVDFSEFSRTAAAAAVGVAAEGAHLRLAHVCWPAPTPASPQLETLDEWVATYYAGARTRLGAIGRELAASRGVRVDVGLLTGDPASSLLGLATETDVELIAAGSHGYGFFGRLILGSVSTALLRRAECSVLIAPPHLEPAARAQAPVAAGRRLGRHGVPAESEVAAGASTRLAARLAATAG